MKSFAAIFFAAAASAAVYQPVAINSTTPAPPVYKTTVVPQYTTVCEAGATVTYGPSSYSTVSKHTTLTVPSYTIVTPVPTAPVESKPATSAPYTPVKPSDKPVAPVYPTSNGTAPAAPLPTGTAAPGAPGSTPAPAFPGAAGKTGLSLLAVAGALAAFL
ncbi:hypothetical protein DM02DRAFT_659259 [Periconia macrospinosa]|uniref:Uncharacterized protein n=1 Tax=Periconia macrospinosa TaxID=97972 RepID=A0A2V1DGV5_9PLEO|nr:hypothetical protein DM02DRAFT_659259 [Periconia macrospinosa]